MVSAFDLKHIAKTDLEEPFYNEVGEKRNVIGTLTAVSMLFGSRDISLKYPCSVTK